MKHKIEEIRGKKDAIDQKQKSLKLLYVESRKNV